MTLIQFLKSLRRNQNIFLELLVEQAGKTLQGIKALESFMKEEHNEESALEVERLEHEADEVRHMLIDKLNRSFVTPIDREDIFVLSRVIDDIIDYAYSTVDEMVTLDVKPNAQLRGMATILREATNEIYLAVLNLQKPTTDILKHTSRAKRLENRAEFLYRKALSELFKDADEIWEILNILKMREIYRHLSNAADRVDDAANVLSDIAVKIT